MQFKSFVAGTLLAAAAASASAVTYTVGTMPIAPAVYSNTASLPFSAVPFSDRYNFVFPVGGSVASGSAVSVNVSGLLNISNIQVSLFTAANLLLASGGVGVSC